MKKQLVNKTLASMLVSMLLLATSVYAENPSPAGYTIFGPNKYGYTDLTGKVQYSNSATFNGQVINGGDYASVPTAASSTISFTGTGHSSHYCQGATAISIRFSESVTMTLTDKYAVHMKIKRTNAGTGDIQSSFIKGTWGSVRVGFLWKGITDTEQEIVLKFSDRTPNEGGYYNEKETDTYGTQTFAGGNWNELFRMTALPGESFEISQIYIKADETQADPVDPSGDKDAPTNLQASVKAGSVKDVSVVITASAEDASAIRFNVYNGTDVIATATSTSGVEKDIEVTGLTPETAYSLDVEAVDAAGNTNPNRVNVQFITTEQFEKRYYFVRSGDLPVIEKMTAVDLRANNSSIAAWSNRTPTLGDSYASWTLPNTWFAADLKPKAQCMSDVTKADWYLRMKFKTDAKALSNQNLRINLSNDARNFFMDNSYGDGEWHDTVYVLANAAGTLRSFPVDAEKVMFQLHANGNLNGSYFYIEYAYLTNVPTNPEKPAIIDDDPPTAVNIAVKDGSLSYDRLTLQLSATDKDTPITYAVKYQVKESGDTWTEVPTFTGTQGTTVEKEITGLIPETAYTFSVVASDPNGNEADAVTTEATTTKLAEKRYYFFRTGDLPTMDGMKAVDLRGGVGTGFTYGNGMTQTTVDNNARFVSNGGWSSFNQELKSSTDMSDVKQDSWTLVVKMRTTITNTSFNIRLNNAGECYQVSQGNLTVSSEWQELKLALADSKKTLSFSSNMNGNIFQMHTEGSNKDEYIDIEYAYLTNMPTKPEQNPQVNPQGLGLYQAYNMKMYNPLNDLPDIDRGIQDRLNLYVVSLGDYVCFKQVTKNNSFDGSEDWRNQICRLNSEATAQSANAFRTYRTSSNMEAGGNCLNFLFGCTDDPIKMNAYAKMWGGNGYYSEIFDFRRGYNNTPSTDRVAPTFSASGKYNTQTQKVTLTFSDPSEEVFYYIVDKATNTPRITISDSIELDYNQGIPDFDVNAVDFNGNFSETITVAPECGTCFPVTF